MEHDMITYYDNNCKFNTVAIGGWVTSGSFSDSKELSGAHHFVEHMLFNNKSIREKLDILKKKGIIYNAFTSHELTCFYVNSLEKDYELGMDFINSILCNNYIFEDATSFENEKKIILNEIEYANNEIENTKYGLLDSIFKNKRYACPIFGLNSTVNKMNIDGMKNVYNKFYVESNKFITISGNIPKANHILNSKQSQGRKDNFHCIEIKVPNNSNIDVKDRDGYCYYGVATYTPKELRKEGQVYSYYIKNEMLNQIREKIGAVYRIDSTNMNFYSGMVSFWIMKIKINSLPLVRKIIETIFSLKDSYLLSTLSEIQIQRLAQNSIRSDNVVSKMLSIGYNKTVLVNEENQIDFERFLLYRAEGKYYEFVT